MKIGVTALNGRFAIEPKEVRSLSALAEEIGFHSWWAADHLVLPSPQTPESPLAPSTSFTDPLIHLAFVAAATSRIRLGTGVLVLPQREPIAPAKQLASLSVLSGGRFTFGLGAGYVDGELAALGVRMSERGDRLDDYLDAMNSLWTSDPATHRGTYTSFEGVAAYPRPECMRLAVGGHSRRAFRRAVARGDSWIGYETRPDSLELAIQGLERAADEVDRPSSLGPLEIVYNPSGRVIATADLDRYRRLGVDEILIGPATNDLRPPDTEEFLRAHADLIAEATDE